MPSTSSLSPTLDFEPRASLSRGRHLGTLAVASSRRGGFVPPRAMPAPVKASRFGPAAWLLLVVASWCALIGARVQIVKIAPAIMPFYAALGLHVNPRQMDISGVVSKLIEEDGRKFLIVEGEIRNLAEAPRAAPRMRLAVIDAQGREIYNWIAAPPKSRLVSGERAFFRARLAAPPEEGRDVRVRFAPEAGAAS